MFAVGYLAYLVVPRFKQQIAGVRGLSGLAQPAEVADPDMAPEGSDPEMDAEMAKLRNIWRRATGSNPAPYVDIPQARR